MPMVFTPVHANASTSVYEVNDGYFYVSESEPIHLVHPFSSYPLVRGDKVYLHIHLNLKPGVINPCTGKDKKECRFSLQFVEKDSTGNERIVSNRYIELNFGSEINFQLNDEVPQRIGDKATFRATVSKNGKEYFRLDI